MVRFCAEVVIGNYEKKEKKYPTNNKQHYTILYSIMSKQISLTQGKFAIVDDEDYERLNQYRWYAHKDGNTYYAICNIGKQSYPQKIRMHRLILGLKQDDKRQTDHRNHNGLDNRKCNIRICTSQQNNQNRKALSYTSKYKGVSWNKRDCKWKAHICLNYKEIYLGYFDNEIKAAQAYDRKAKELFGEFVYTNF